ncbi:DnaJ domain-containing protein [Enterococcus faecium]|uniref:DnaJ domain-containing protein n=1 Tax=Enterococcus faecium TaxID=1352 RepID=UPI000AFEB865|nr:DnaJ domain-containing protein [Enterococcus faecium]
MNKYFHKCTYLFTFLLKEKNEKKDTSEHTQQSSNQNRNNEKTSLVINEPFELEAYFRLILGVDEQATKEEIKHAYRQKVMKYHPDKSVEENAKEKYEEIIEAYKYLK